MSTLFNLRYRGHPLLYILAGALFLCICGLLISSLVIGLIGFIVLALFLGIIGVAFLLGEL
jgi:hypothetical protein